MPNRHRRARIDTGAHESTRWRARIDALACTNRHGTGTNRRQIEVADRGRE